MRKIMSYTAVLTLGLALGWSGALWTNRLDTAPAEADVTSTAAAPARAPLVGQSMTQVAISPEINKITGGVDVDTAAAAKADPSEYTEIQRRLVEAIKRSAEASNDAEGSVVADGVTLDHVTVEGLQVTYFYTIDRPYAVINHVSIREEKTAQIQASLCANPGVKTIYEHGLRYAYHFFSSDDKMVIRIDGDIEGC